MKAKLFCNECVSRFHYILALVGGIGRVGRYLKNQLTIIVMGNIAIIDNIAINEIENDHYFKYN